MTVKELRDLMIKFCDEGDGDQEVCTSIVEGQNVGVHSILDFAYMDINSSRPKTYVAILGQPK